MLETLPNLPLPFYLSALALLAFVGVAWTNRRTGWGLPMGMVLATTAVWYHGDALYNDYENYRMIIGDSALESAWWQVLLFVVGFGLFVRPLHETLNARLEGRRSNIVSFIETRRLEHPQIQRRIDRLTRVMFGVWVMLMIVALVRVNFDVLGLFAPYLGQKANPWARGRIGGGIDAVLSLAGYVQIFLVASFGVIAAVARNPATRTIAIVVCILAFPYYLFDRTRNTMLATMLPGILAWALFRVQGGLIGKAAVLLMAFLAINFWFGFVIANRHEGVVQAFKSGEGVERMEDAKHEGISMFSELGYINDFFERGTYQPNWGQRYFAEIVNPIPRALWKNKPEVGLDYSVARGFAWEGAKESEGGVAASISTGMIGQGAVNFGRFFGPLAAALLMALWTACLARQDLLGRDPGRLLLFSCGMVLTFNMGRDITFLVLYPFVFGWLLVMAKQFFEKAAGKGVSPERTGRRKAKSGARRRGELVGKR